MATSAREWKKSSKSALHDLELPSGHVAQVRAPGMQAFISGGFIPNSLLDIVQSELEINSGKPKKSAEASKKQSVEFMKQLQSDPQKTADLFDTIDKVTVHCVVQPPLEFPPDNPDHRDDDVLYVDEVDFEDKMYIFQFAVGGAKDLERFRKETASNVDALENESKSKSTSKRTTARKR
jgi:hypothetical protein